MLIPNEGKITSKAATKFWKQAQSHHHPPFINGNSSSMREDFKSKKSRRGDEKPKFEKDKVSALTPQQWKNNLGFPSLWYECANFIFFNIRLQERPPHMNAVSTSHKGTPIIRTQMMQ